MTRSAATVTTLPGASILGQVARVFISLAKAFQDRRQVRNLAEFDERMLKDIGLTRGDVASALAEPLHHRPSWVLVRCAKRIAPVARATTPHKARPIVQSVRRA